MSSNSDNWETPQWLKDEITKEFGTPDDPCPINYDREKHKDGLAELWMGTVYCNPPYSQIAKWVKKAYEESLEKYNDRVIMLIPARTDTKYWHEYIMRATEIRLIKGRLKFSESKNSAPFPSALVIFDKSYTPRITNMEKPKDA